MKTEEKIIKWLGEVVDPKMTRFSFPPRWRYDIMRALDYFQDCQAPRDDRCCDAIELVKKKQQKEGGFLLWERRYPCLRTIPLLGRVRGVDSRYLRL